MTFALQSLSSLMHQIPLEEKDGAFNSHILFTLTFKRQQVITLFYRKRFNCLKTGDFLTEPTDQKADPHKRPT